jgi:hypothetical protein
MIQQEHLDMREHRHYTAPDYKPEPTEIDRVLGNLGWYEQQEAE